MSTCQDETDQWKALPYEAAGALVRSLMLHCHKLANFQEAKAKALQDDPECKKASTQKCVERVEQNLHVEKYLVFNPRTGQMATEAWLGKHILVVAGKPKFKHPSKEHKNPKILTLKIKVLDDNVELTLDISDSTIGQRPVRCFDLRSSQPQGTWQCWPWASLTWEKAQ